MAAENKPAGKGSHVSLLMHNLEESKNSEDGSDEEEEKQPGKLLAEKSRTVDDLLDEFNEAFRMKVSLFLKVKSKTFSLSDDHVQGQSMHLTV